MRRRYSFSIVLLLSLSFFGLLEAQTVFWTENFNNGCASNCVASTYNGWSIQNNVGGTSGGSPNNWFVSCAEEGVVPPGCGSTCLGDASLHIGADPGGGGDMGASFNETAATNATFKRVVSPTISTVGRTAITLNFDHIAYGSASCADDRCQLQLSTDNGATWPAGFQFCLNTVCCGACNGYSQGQWTLYTMALPSAFDNNPNVRIGFHWRNNGNGSGTDPSAAIDDIQLSTAIITPVTLLNFKATEDKGQARLDWLSTDEQQLSNYEVLAGSQPDDLNLIGKLGAKGNGRSGQFSYSFKDPAQLLQTRYYRLKMVDGNGSSSYSNILRFEMGQNQAISWASVVPQPAEAALDLRFWSVDDASIAVEVHDLQGRLLRQLPAQNLIAGENKLQVDLSEMASGSYLLSVRSLHLPKGYAPVKLNRKFVWAK